MAAALYYFPFAGRGELIRLIAAAGGIELVEGGNGKDVDKSDFGSSSGLPLLSHGTLKMSQSGAIESYLAFLAFPGIAPVRRAKDSQLMCIKEDLIAAFSKLFHDPATQNAEAEYRKVVDKWYPIIEGLCPADGFINKVEHPTCADLAIVNICEAAVPFGMAHGRAQLDLPARFPKMAALSARAAAFPPVAAYLARSPSLRLNPFAVQSAASSPSASKEVKVAGPPTVDMDTKMSVIVFGATGDLARKKLYPALYQLMFGCPDAPLIPQNATIVGYGRSEVDLQEFLAKQCVNVKGEHKERFLSQCKFFAGAYDKEDSFTRLHDFLAEEEGGGKANRLFFFSVPPTVFGSVVQCIKASACAPAGGWTRLILEKPFGRDSRTFAELNSLTASLFGEDELFRIDHYLGKEVVLNLVALRFGNQMFEAIWNRQHIASVEIVFKEDLGTGGRGGYFDGFGIIRDIMQNHLLQVMMWFAIEPPADLSREQIQAQKVKLLKAVKTLTIDDVFLGQFGSNSWEVNGQTHNEPGYLEDKTVPAGSKCPTYAAVAMQIDNDRWRGVPFVMRAGKGLDERMSEVRVTFKKKDFNALVPGNPDELVMRIQPDESIFIKYQNKAPGWETGNTKPVVLDMSYQKRFPGAYVADAYERMFLNAAKGDGSLFVGADELTEAWRIFTPLLDEIDERKPQPMLYPFGVRVPDGMDAWAAKYGIHMAESWSEFLAMYASNLKDLKKTFNSLTKSQDGVLNTQEIKNLCKQFFDDREPSDKQVGMIMARLDKNGDGHITYDELEQSVQTLAGYCSVAYLDDQKSPGWGDADQH